MDLQGTLERGFSLQESTPDHREELYDSFKVDYKHETKFSTRYGPTLKHFIPVRKEKWLEILQLVLSPML